MTSVNQVFDAIEALVESCLDGYKMLENPIIPEDNAKQIYNKSYGLAIGPGTNPELMTKDITSCQRDFSIVLINKVTTTKAQTDRRNDQQKSIMEDLEKIKVCLDRDPDLGNLCTRATLLSDTGINFIDADRGKYYLVEGTIDTLYFDNF